MRSQGNAPIPFPTGAKQLKHDNEEVPTPANEPISTSTTASSAETGNTHVGYRALDSRDFRLLLGGTAIGMLGQQMIAVAIGWELYNETSSALVLGGVGLAQIIPIILLFLPAGYIVDRYNRKYIMIASQIVMALSSLALAALSYLHGPLFLIYGCLVAIGSAQAFNSPTSSTLMAQVIPEQAFENAMTWRSSTVQMSAIIGPAISGFLIGIFHNATPVFVLNGIAATLFIVFLALMRIQRQQIPMTQKRSLSSLVEGIRFLGKTPIMLAAITLDLFAVLLGGATTLMPIFARDILHVGPLGLGWLQAASSLGAVSMAYYLAHKPPFIHAGRTLLLAVAGFGAATILFGLSQWFWLSLLTLFLIGAFDNISVVIRSTLVLVRTPDEMRGRVSAVNSLFIGTSNQLGGFESGLAAQLFGPIVAVVAGGVGTILVVLLVAWFWPEIRNLSTLREITG
jgi:MFS family permease